jgi:hypothetical protein
LIASGLEGIIIEVEEENIHHYLLDGFHPSILSPIFFLFFKVYPKKKRRHPNHHLHLPPPPPPIIIIIPTVPILVVEVQQQTQTVIQIVVVSPRTIKNLVVHPIVAPPKVYLKTKTNQ